MTASGSKWSGGGAKKWSGASGGASYRKEDPAPKNPDETQITVNLNATPRFKGEDGVFAIWGGTRADGKGGTVTVKGSLGNRVANEMLLCKGKWKEHPQHGWAFIVDKCRSSIPKNAEGMKRFLTARVPGIGPVFAQAIVDTFGDDAFEKIDADPEILHQVKTPGGRSIAKNQVTAVIGAWEGVRQVRAIETFLFSFDVEQWLAVQLYQRYGHEVIGILENDPYRITQMRGVGFTTADKIARSMGVPLNDPKRLQAGLLYVLEESEDKHGHCYLTDLDLCASVSEMLKVSDLDVIHEACKALSAQGQLVIEDEDDGGQRMYRTPTFELEVELSSRIRKMVKSDATISHAPDRPTVITEEQPFLPTDEQWHAVKAAFTSRISVMTGGPGVGKTQTTKDILQVATAMKLHVELGAPTGKAARRMTELTGHHAQTIHRLLAWSPQEGTFMHDESNPISADLIIIDESSMLNLDLAVRVLRAIGPRTHLVLVGDVDQLPPIGAGKPLDDIISSEVVPTTRLTQIFRQAAKSMIITNAHRMNRYHQSRCPDAPYFSHEDAMAGEGQSDMLQDFWWVNREDPEMIVPTIVKVFKHRLHSLAAKVQVELDPLRDVMVLVPQNPGPAGIGAINDALQQALNPNGMKLPGPRGIRVGDRIQQQKNNYDLGIMNGETAQVIAYNEADKAVTMRLDDPDETQLTCSVLELDTFKVAYAMSIHKSQGSQFKCVIVVCTRQHNYMLTKSILYTAVTRASKVCVMIGQGSTLMRAIGKTDLSQRNSMLRERIIEATMTGELF